MKQYEVYFKARSGKFIEVSVNYNGRVDEQVGSPLLNSSSKNYNGPVEIKEIESTLMGRELNKITDWEEVLPPFLFADGERQVPTSPGRVMNELFGLGNYEPSAYVRE